jgi:hypothetical protein
MNQTTKPMDLVALIGMGTSIAGILLCLFLLFVPATFGATGPDAMASSSVDLQVSMRWIQPILGQAIVEDTLIKQQYGSEITDAIDAPNHMTMAAQRLNGGKPHALASACAGAMEMDHAARVQWLMGRVIVELTRHRVRTGILTADRLVDGDNHQIVTLAQQAGKKLDDVFRTEPQARLGQAIVTQTRNHARSAEQSPERIGLIF